MKQSSVMAIPLPAKYALLERFFNAIESSMYCQKRSSVPFVSLKIAVESTLRKTLDEQVLGKLLRVYPEAYTISRDPTEGTLLIALPDNQEHGGIASAQQSLTRRRLFKHKLVQLLLVTDKIIPIPMPGDGPSPMNSVTEQQQQSRPGLDLNAVVASEEGRSDKRKHEEGGAKENKRRNVPAGLKGLPESLIESIRARKEKERLLDPKAVAERQRGRILDTLPALFDLVYVHFKQSKKFKCDLDKLVDTLAQNSASGWQGGAAQYKDKAEMIREQLQLLLERIPEFCEAR